MSHHPQLRSVSGNSLKNSSLAYSNDLVTVKGQYEFQKIANFSKQFLTGMARDSKRSFISRIARVFFGKVEVMVKWIQIVT